MAGDPELRVHCACVLGSDLTHGPRKRLDANLHQEMQVIGHPTVRVNTGVEFLDRASDDQIQQVPISFGEENVVLMIATQCDVVEAAGKVNS
jgi:hypothetical protein